MGTSSRTRRAGVALMACAVVMALAPVVSAKSGPSVAIQGLATGTVVHVDAIESGGTRLVDVEVAFSGASVNSFPGLNTPAVNEVGRQVQSALPSKVSFARGSGLEVGTGVSPQTDNQVILAGKVEAAALPSTGLLEKDITVNLKPLAFAGLARGQGQAHWMSDGDPCNTLGRNISYGNGYVTDVQLVETGTSTVDEMQRPVLSTSHPDPVRAVSQSTSRTILVPQVDANGKRVGNNFGMLSETRQTIAPVTLFKGTSNQFTIELLGEWVLQSVSTGLPGGSFVHYGPAATTPDTPVIRTIDAKGVTSNFSLQQVLGKNGIGAAVPGIAEIAIGEAPRAVNGAYGTQPARSSDGTNTAAAVDVVRVKLLENSGLLGPVSRVTDLRVGHMETQSKVPAGGIQCSLPVSKAGDSPTVPVGGVSTTTISVLNPYGCPVEDVAVKDSITTERDARFEITSAVPAATSHTPGAGLATGSVEWSNIGGIAVGASKKVSVAMNAQNGAGVIVDVANATGTLNCPADSDLGRTTIFGASVGKVGLVGTPAVVRISTGRAARTDILPVSGVRVSDIAGLAFALLCTGAVCMVWARREETA